jgi:type I restriction enzyme S subunit
MNETPKTWLYHPAFPEPWTRQPLYSLATWVNGLVFRDIHFNPTGRPVIKIAEVKNGVSEQTKFTEQTFDESVRVRCGDLIFSWSGQPETSIDVYWWRGPDGWLNQHLFRVTPIPAVDSVFLFYLLRYIKPNFVEIARNKQTTGLGHVTRRDLETVQAAYPPLTEQRAIAEVLGALDDKIENCRNIVELTWHLSLSLYDNATSKGNRAVDIASVAEFHNRRRVPLSSRQRAGRKGPFPYYGAAGVVDHVDDYLFDGAYVLVGEDGTVSTDGVHPMVQYVWGKFWVNNHAHVLSGHGISSELLRCTITRSEIVAAVTGAVQQKVSMSNLKNVSVLIPESSERLEQTLDVLAAQERTLAEEATCLTRLRDSLLPRLLSGELRVRDAEAAVEGAV